MLGVIALESGHSACLAVEQGVMTSRQASLLVPETVSTRKSQSEAPAVKYAELVRLVNRATMLRWLRRHAMRLPAGPLSEQLERDIAECFRTLDEDGSGALDVSELVRAFRMLGFKADQTSVRELMKQVQGEARRELQQHEFRALMAYSLSADGGGAAENGTAGIPFQEIARATRRKQNLHKLLTGGLERQKFIEGLSAGSEDSKSTQSLPSAKAKAGGSSNAAHPASKMLAGRPKAGSEDDNQAEQLYGLKATCLIDECMEVAWDAEARPQPRWNFRSPATKGQ